jgi:hypothetical protein
MYIDEEIVLFYRDYAFRYAFDDKSGKLILSACILDTS